MAVLRANVENTKNYLRARNGLPYVLGGAFSDTDVKRSTDCSGITYAAVAGCQGLPMNRRYGSTEAFRKGSVENRDHPWGSAQLNLVHAGSNRANVPADAVVKLGFHHNGGGVYSHVSGEIDGLAIESRGGTGVIVGSVKHGGTTYWPRLWNDSYYHDFWYLPGPIVGELDPNAFPLPSGYYYGWYSGPEQSISGRAGEPKAWIDGLARAQEKLGVPVTRVYDAATNAAAMAFQRKHNFALVDGFIGVKTWPLLMGENKGGDDTLSISKDELRELIYECLDVYVGPIGSDVKDCRQQLTGARNDHEGYPGFVQGGKRTLYDLTAAVAEKAGVEGTKDTMRGRK